MDFGVFWLWFQVSFYSDITNIKINAVVTKYGLANSPQQSLALIVPRLVVLVIYVRKDRNGGEEESKAPRLASFKYRYLDH